MVFPDADVKVYPGRLHRGAGPAPPRSNCWPKEWTSPLDELVADIAARDAYDSGRALAPLRKADDAVEIDTTGMTIPEVIQAVCALVEAKRIARRRTAAARGRPVGQLAKKWPLSPHGAQPARHLALPLRLLVHPAAVAGDASA